MAENALTWVAQLQNETPAAFKQLTESVRQATTSPGVRDMPAHFSFLTNMAGAAAQNIKSLLVPVLSNIGVKSLTAAGAITGAFTAATSAARGAMSLKTLSTISSVSIENIDRWRKAARAAGLETETMDQSIKNFGLTVAQWNTGPMHEAAGQAFALKETLRAMGGEYKNVADDVDRAVKADSSDTNSAMVAFFDSLDKWVKDPRMKAWILEQAGFDARAINIAEHFRQATAGTQAALEQSEQFIKNWEDFKEIVINLRNTLFNLVGPWMTESIKLMNELFTMPETLWKKMIAAILAVTPPWLKRLFSWQGGAEQGPPAPVAAPGGGGTEPAPFSERFGTWAPQGGHMRNRFGLGAQRPGGGDGTGGGGTGGGTGGATGGGTGGVDTGGGAARPGRVDTPAAPMKYGGGGAGDQGATEDMLSARGMPADVLAQAQRAALAGGGPAVQQYLRSKGYPVSGNWCGYFAAAIVKEAGGTPPKHPEVASNWMNYGTKVDEPQPGDIAVRKVSRYGGMARPGETGSHVTVFEEQLPGGRFRGIGGNQGSTRSSFPLSQYEFHRGGGVLPAGSGAVGTGQPPGVSGGRTDLSGGGAAFLTRQRAAFKREIDADPKLRDEVMATGMLEMWSDPGSVIESLANRYTYINQERAKKGLPPISVRSLIHGGFYAPVNKGRLPGEVANLDRYNNRQKAGAALNDVLTGGRNVLEGRTDQGSPNDPNARGSGLKVIKGEHYTDFAGGPGGAPAARAFREQQQRGFLEAERTGRDKLQSMFFHGAPSSGTLGDKLDTFGASRLDRALRKEDSAEEKVEGSANIKVEVGESIKAPRQRRDVFKKTTEHRAQQMGTATTNSDGPATFSERFGGE